MRSAVLADLLDFSDSGVWGADDPETGISVLRSTNFRSDGTLSFVNLAYRAVDPAKRASKKLAPGDLLLEKSGGGPAQPVGRVALFVGDSQPHAFGNFIARLRPKSAVLSEYLWYYLRYFHAQGKTSYFQKQTTGIRNLEFRRYLSIQVPLCPVEEQRRIVDLLARAEGIVRLRREAQQKAAQLIPAIFIDLFGDPASNSKGWSLTTLGELLASVDYGSSTKASSTGAGLPIIRMGNVTAEGSLDLEDLKFVELNSNDVDRFRLRTGDLLFNRTNSKDLVGKTGLWDGSLDAVVASYFIRLRARREVALPSYLWAWLNSRHMKRVLFDTARGAIGQANINSKELKAFKVAVPPMGLQNAFELRVQSVRALCRQQRIAAATAHGAAQSLLGKMFEGAP